jgi:hypothetical protein
MPQKSKLVHYVLLNILVSALTVLIVLWIWDKTHPLPVINSDLPDTAKVRTSESSTSQLADQTPTAILPDDQIKLSIEGVFAVSVEKMEYVLIQNQSAAGINLLDWQLASDKGDTYIFPALTLNADGRVKLFTGRGTNSVIELYWGLPETIWHSGDVVSLKDNNGIERASYQIP